MDDEEIPLAEVARRVGLTQQRVSKIAATHPDFPPRRKVGTYQLVWWSAAERWFDAHPPRGRPGRPPKE